MEIYWSWRGIIYLLKMKLNCKYDYIIIGAGLFGAICARELTDKGYLCLVIDSREHIGGNCYTKNIDDINIHVYGPHIFHTSNIKIWDYINKFATFNDYRHKKLFLSFHLNS